MTAQQGFEEQWINWLDYRTRAVCRQGKPIAEAYKKPSPYLGERAPSQSRGIAVIQ